LCSSFPAGVTSDSTAFRSAFTAAVLSVLPSGSSVTIVSVTVVGARRFLLAPTGVTVVYVVASTQRAATLTSSLTAGTAAMTAALQQTFPGAVVAAPTVTTVSSPSARPTGAPFGSNGYNSNAGLIAGVVAGVVVVVGICGVFVTPYIRRYYNAKKYRVYVDRVGP